MFQEFAFICGIIIMLKGSLNADYDSNRNYVSHRFEFSLTNAWSLRRRVSWTDCISKWLVKRKHFVTCQI
jgi:hypothetical protein